MIHAISHVHLRLSPPPHSHSHSHSLFPSLNQRSLLPCPAIHLPLLLPSLKMKLLCSLKGEAELEPEPKPLANPFIAYLLRNLTFYDLQRSFQIGTYAVSMFTVDKQSNKVIIGVAATLLGLVFHLMKKEVKKPPREDGDGDGESDIESIVRALDNIAQAIRDTKSD